MAGIIRSIAAIFVGISSFFVPVQQAAPIDSAQISIPNTLELKQRAVDIRKSERSSRPIDINTSQTFPQKSSEPNEALVEILPSTLNTNYIGADFANRAFLGTTTGTVVGYLWESKEGPTFASVKLPAWGFLEDDFDSREYEVYLLQGDRFVLYQKAHAVVDEIKFPEGGTRQFKVLGINPKLGICGTDRNVTWTLMFAGSGSFKGARSPITDDVPNPDCVKKYEALLKNSSTNE